MRIFYASDTTPNSHFDSNLWRNNLYLPLEDLGHEVIEFDYDLRETFRNLDRKDPLQRAFIQKNRPRLSAELLRQVREEHARKPLDLFFSYFYDACVEPGTIDAIRALGIKTVNWYCNGSYQMDLVSEISPHYDWCLVPEKFRLKDYEKLGAHPIYCQEAANPKIYKPYPGQSEFDVTFVGQAYGERPDYIQALLEQRIDVRVWGMGWDKYTDRPSRAPRPGLGAKMKRAVAKIAAGEGLDAIRNRLRRSGMAGREEPQVRLPHGIVGDILSDEEMIRMYSRSKINLGFSSVGNTHRESQRIVQVRLRDFEVPMSGGFYMVEHMEELEEFFRVGEEIVCYRSSGDLAEKIKYYLTHDSERERIRRAGYERAQRDHTWQKRFEMAFKEMGI